MRALHQLQNCKAVAALLARSKRPRAQGIGLFVLIMNGAKIAPPLRAVAAVNERRRAPLLLQKAPAPQHTLSMQSNKNRGQIQRIRYTSRCQSTRKITKRMLRPNTAAFKRKN